jgi:hypothetical protein
MRMPTAALDLRLATARAHDRPAVGIHLTPHQILALVGLGVLLAAGYWISLRVRPFATCRRCHGTGKVGGFFFAWARDFCPKCDGYGIVPRLGTFLLSAQNRPQVPGGAVR